LTYGWSALEGPTKDGRGRTEVLYPSPGAAPISAPAPRQSDLYRRLMHKLNVKSGRKNRPGGRISPRLTQ
jgi:hypothetical protein